MTTQLRSRVKNLEKTLCPKEKMILVWVGDDESHAQAEARTLKEQNLTEEDLNPNDITIFIDWRQPNEKEQTI